MGELGSLQTFLLALPKHPVMLSNDCSLDIGLGIFDNPSSDLGENFLIDCGVDVGVDSFDRLNRGSFDSRKLSADGSRDITSGSLLGGEGRCFLGDKGVVGALADLILVVLVCI